MSDSLVQHWRQRGHVFLWRYRDRPRNYPGWHLSADPRGAHSLSELLSLMRDAPYSSKQSVQISDPTPEVLAVPNYIRGGDHWQTAHLWRLRYDKDQANQQEWGMTFTGRELKLTLGEKYLLELIGGVADLAEGRGDHAISSDDADHHDCLWFWWWHGAA